MKWTAYPKYKDSGVDWIEEMPERWDIVSVKYVALLQSGEQITAENIEQSGEYPVFGGNGVRGYTDNYTHDGYFPIIGRQGALCGNISFSQGKFWASEHAIVVAPLTDSNIIWLGELLRVMNLGQYSTAAAQPGLAVESINKLRIPFPSIREQYSIAAFIRKKITEIDILIVEQEKLITLLQEKRQAVISHAVTKGLNPDAPMKDSGVEWLGKIPEKWDVVKFKYCAYIAEGLVDPTEKHQGDKILIAPDHVEKGTGRILMLETAEQQGAISNKYTVSPGQIIYSKIRPALNKLCIARGDWLCSADMYPLTPSDNCASDFMLYYMLSPIFVSYAQLISDRVAMPKINREQLSIVCVPIPPLTEQRIIVKYLDAETEKIDVLIAEAQRTTELLYERCQALISAAVTGKIDVRGLTASEPA